MKKIINIEGREIAFASNGATLLLYRKAFGKDFLKVVVAATKLDLKTGKTDTNNIDLSLLEYINEFAYICAKTANKNIEPYEEWLASFEDPSTLMEHANEIMELIGNGLSTSVEPKDKKK